MIDRRHFIAGATALAISGRANAAARQRTNPAIAAAVQRLDLPSDFSGIIAHAVKGRIDFLRTYGWADVEARIPVDAETKFAFGSASKWLTSVAVLRLAEQGALRLDAPIATYLPDFRPDTGSRVTLDHLLSNTSGIPDLLSRQLKSEPELRTSTASAAAIVSRFGGGDLAFAPGDGWDYAALNWVIVRAIVERITGEAFEAVVERLVFKPLGMSRTVFANGGKDKVTGMAAAYQTLDPPVRKMSPVPAFAGASGNVAGTAADAVRAAHGIFATKLLRDASRRELVRIRRADQEYALGGRIHRIGNADWGWETGKVDAYRAHIAHRLDGDRTIVIFNNGDLGQTPIGGWVETLAAAV
ncbi:serine hydrolase [Sphingosinicella sp. BN140058]|uniref:serine hydrolase domain-containing protein n=1 Tax=Sphingosinicella sp. BN140058 TaxID=1892855 RepID=UPI0010100E58|nr:serine hydrolase domain-containing protein [Sphingosinicella sp. BN140058]QAY78358.1 class A beta-lactamase-related serine hydrolase [Sphingosinicella sp. BN140058]